MGKIREKGKWNYIVKYGVLLWGITSAVVCSIIMRQTNEETSFLLNLGINLVVFPLSGIIFGYLMWGYMEKAYKKSKSS